MGNETTENFIVAILDEGIDKLIEDFKGINFTEVEKIPAKILEYEACSHGTEVFGVFYRTFNALTKNYNSDRSLKDNIHVID